VSLRNRSPSCRSGHGSNCSFGVDQPLDGFRSRCADGRGLCRRRRSPRHALRQLQRGPRRAVRIGSARTVQRETAASRSSYFAVLPARPPRHGGQEHLDALALELVGHGFLRAERSRWRTRELLQLNPDPGFPPSPDGSAAGSREANRVRDRQFRYRAVILTVGVKTAAQSPGVLGRAGGATEGGSGPSIRLCISSFFHSNDGLGAQPRQVASASSGVALRSRRLFCACTSSRAVSNDFHRGGGRRVELQQRPARRRVRRRR